MRISTAARLEVEGCLEEAESVDPVGLLVSVLTMSASNLREDKEGDVRRAFRYIGVDGYQRRLLVPLE